MLGKEGDDSLGPQPRCTTCQRCDWADSAGSLMPGVPQLGSTALERRRPVTAKRKLRFLTLMKLRMFLICLDNFILRRRKC